MRGTRTLLTLLAAMALVLGASTLASAARGTQGPPPDAPGRPDDAPGPPDHANPKGGPFAEEEPPDDDPVDPPAEPLRLNHLQARGTHNSTHRDPKGVVTDHETFGWGYSHRTLTAQFEEQGVRQVEIDVHYNWAKDDFDVYHVWFGDDRVTCDTLRGCLSEIRAWSDAHPDSVPIMVLVEPKDAGAPYSLTDPAQDPGGHLPEDGDPFTRPLDAHAYDRLDEILLDAFDGPMHEGGRVVTPDDVVTPGKTLRQTILEDGWPVLDDVRGHVLYVVDGPDHAEPYSDGWTDLGDRAMFVQADPAVPVAAFVTRSGAGEKYERMQRLVEQGFMVRDLVSSLEDLEANLGRALAAGAHFVSTDHPEQITFDDPDSPVQCNSAALGDSGPGCASIDLERHVEHGHPVPADPSDEYDQVIVDKVDRLVVGSAESIVAIATDPEGARPPAP